MTRLATRNWSNGGAWRLSRLSLILLCLASLTIQGYLTQTHFHPVRNHVAAAERTHGSEKQPAGDAGHCFLCHQAAAAGTYLPAAPILYLLPCAILAFAPVIADKPSTIRSLSHGWRGRGPPRF